MTVIADRRDECFAGIAGAGPPGRHSGEDVVGLDRGRRKLDLSILRQASMEKPGRSKATLSREWQTYRTASMAFRGITQSQN